jgi:NAD-dependent deacetylase
MPDPSNDSEATFVEWLKSARCVLAFCGAGVSAESGVPTFRGAGGLWEGHRIEEVATPEAFERNPQLVWRFYAARQSALLTVHPNPAHEVLAAMERHYGDFLLVTQNVDDLHERAGSRNLIKLHGSLMEIRCSGCDAWSQLPEPVSLESIEAGTLPTCTCGALLRPNVVWFGEWLDMRHFARIEEFMWQEPDLLLVIGTSGVVSGGYGLTRTARSHGAKVVEINPEASALSGDANLVLREPAGALLGRVWPSVAGGSGARA